MSQFYHFVAKFQILLRRTGQITFRQTLIMFVNLLLPEETAPSKRK